MSPELAMNNLTPFSGGFGPALSPEAPSHRILLVEDDFFLADIYQTKLSIANYEVVVAGDGMEGLQQAQSQLPDLILLDIMLPKMDGLDVLKRLKADVKTKNIPVILLSNLGQEFVVNGGMSLGAVDYLVKSDLTPREVIDKIKKYLLK